MVVRSVLQEVLDKHALLFKEGLGLFKGPTVKFHVDSDVCPIYLTSHSTLYALRERS